jgi:acyl transferase domain-containing protein/acyl carrier protein
MSEKELLTNNEAIAIVGVAGRFSGARTMDEFWQNLCNGVESISFFSEDESLILRIKPELIHDPGYVKARGILDDVEYFDAAFFGYSPAEVAMIDPQQRLFLECAWEVLEQAGCNPDTYEGLIGVYAGQNTSTYLLSNLLTNPTFLAENGTFSAMLNNDKDYLATRTCYKLNLKGPGISVQTACSTSLVAVHMACQALLHYECDMALAGGVSIIVPQKTGYLYEDGGIQSPDGHCRAFDADAQGTVFSNGLGIVALKRLSDAEASGDTIHAIIRGSAINNDGAGKVGYVAPSVEGQAKVIAEAIVMAGVEPESISYVETHGTGTALGDPIEIAALIQAFRESSGSQRAQGTGGQAQGTVPTCAIGSLKTNLGHLDAAAGIAGLIKTVLALKHGMIPPSLHFHRPNPKIDFARSPFYVNTHLTTWKRGNTPRRAGVNSFGIGGTNAHIILEEAPPLDENRGESASCLSDLNKRSHLVVLSAKTPSALETMTERLATYVNAHPDIHLADIAYTLQMGRKSFPYRRAFVAQDRTDMLDLLTTHEPRPVKGFSPYSDFVSSETKQVVFLFPGQGTQYVNMARELYEEEPVFRQQVDICAKLFFPHLKRNMLEIIYPATEQASNPLVSSLVMSLHQTDITQPALFVIEYALAQLLMKWGIHPQAMIGHSIGEYVAACLAGVFSLEDAVALVALRGRLMQALPPGGMLSVPLPTKDVEEFLGEELALAACNGTNESVVSGTLEAIELLAKRLTEKNISYHRLHTSHAFHSQMMDPILERFSTEVSKRALHPPKIPYISNVTGTWITDEEATNPAYWAQHIRQTVRFAEGIQFLLSNPTRILLEVGPGHSLSTLARRAVAPRRDSALRLSDGDAQSSSGHILSSLRHPQTQVSDRAFLLNTCGRLWCAGVSLDWSQLHADSQRRRIPLPTYPFERERYWISPPPVGAGLIPTHLPEADLSLPPPKQPDIAQWFSVPSWKRFPLLALPTPSDQSRQKACWLLFTDTVGLGTRLREHLREQGDTIITVSAGTQFCPISAEEYTLRPESRADYDSLLKDIHSHGLFPTHIIHLWTVIALDQIPSELDYCETAQALGFYSLLFLTQALGEQNGGSRDDAIGATSRTHPQPLEIAVISNNLQEVIGGEALCPARATALGVSRIAPYEYPHMSFRSIDIVLPEAVRTGAVGAIPCGRPVPTDEEQLVDQIITELRSRSSDMEVAYRGSHRWVRGVEPVRLEKVLEEHQPSAPAQRLQGKVQGLRQQGVYLITGGLGGIGLVLAEDLAKSVKAKLVLTGRAALPAREEWVALTAHTSGDPDAVTSRILQIKRLEELGAEVLVIQADVTDLQQMQNAIQLIKQRFGALHGVIHAAGITDDGQIQLKKPEVAAKVLAPKVKGTLVLETALKEVQPDFLILCSSLSALIGEQGRVDYCAANTFLDSFAFSHTAQQQHVRTISINWDAWLEAGMAARTIEQFKNIIKHNKEIQKRIQNAMSPQEGVEAFRRIIAYGTTPQLLVSASDILIRLQRAKSFLFSAQSLISHHDVPTAPPGTLHQRPHLQTAYVAPQNETQQQIADIWQELLGIEKVGIHDNFIDLGGHSLLGTQLMIRLRDAFQVDLSLRTLFEEPTVAGLALTLLQKKSEDVDDALLLQAIENVEQLTDDETQTLLATDMHQTGRE